MFPAGKINSKGKCLENIFDNQEFGEEAGMLSNILKFAGHPTKTYQFQRDKFENLCPELKKKSEFPVEDTHGIQLVAELMRNVSKDIHGHTNEILHLTPPHPFKTSLPLWYRFKCNTYGY